MEQFQNIIARTRVNLKLLIRKIKMEVIAVTAIIDEMEYWRKHVLS